ncbi:MAG: flagellar biosynthetic protein FliO [Candidatus Gastranaerophilaceae bacterium]
MQHYFIQFLAYTMAMVGFLAICVVIYKKLGINSFSQNNKDLYIENGLRINARKYIYIIKAGNERFLVASDTERTTMLAKLQEDENPIKKSQEINKTVDIQSINEIKNDEISKTPLMMRISNKMKA